jgi:hypothetical protein
MVLLIKWHNATYQVDCPKGPPYMCPPRFTIVGMPLTGRALLVITTLTLHTMLPQLRQRFS